MDPPYRPPMRRYNEPQGQPPSVRYMELALRLNELDRELEDNTVKFNNHIHTVRSALINCNDSERRARSSHATCLNQATRLSKNETKLAMYQGKVVEIKDRMSTIDRRRSPSAKLTEERRALKKTLRRLREKIESQQRRLNTDKKAITQLANEFTTNVNSAIAEREEAFALAKRMKQDRLELIAERNHLLTIQSNLKFYN